MSFTKDFAKFLNNSAAALKKNGVIYDAAAANLHERNCYQLAKRTPTV